VLGLNRLSLSALPGFWCGHLNTLYPAVWNRGYTLYPSRAAQQAGGIGRDRLTSLPLIPWQDPLRALIHQTHHQHLRLIPWFEYGLWMPTSALAQYCWRSGFCTGALGSRLPGRIELTRFYPKRSNSLFGFHPVGATVGFHHQGDLEGHCRLHHLRNFRL
jgi:hypothetical protein